MSRPVVVAAGTAVVDVLKKVCGWHDAAARAACEAGHVKIGETVMAPDAALAAAREPQWFYLGGTRAWLIHVKEGVVSRRARPRVAELRARIVELEAQLEQAHINVKRGAEAYVHEVSERATLIEDMHRLSLDARALVDALPKCATPGCRDVAGVDNDISFYCAQHADENTHREHDWTKPLAALRLRLEER